jgi:hypothetical protein
MSPSQATLAALLAGLAGAMAAPPSRPGATGDAVTVSGISSGGYMAVQFQVAFSKQVKGAGGGPYDCAEGSTWRALANCMSPALGAAAQARRDQAAHGIPRPPGLIDPRRPGRRQGVGAGRAADHTVEPPVVDALVAFYRQPRPTLVPCRTPATR